jgi:hypothetical protein
MKKSQMSTIDYKESQMRMKIVSNEDEKVVFYPNVDEGKNILLYCSILCSQPSFNSNMKKNSLISLLPFTLIELLQRYNENYKSI